MSDLSMAWVVVSGGRYWTGEGWSFNKYDARRYSDREFGKAQAVRTDRARAGDEPWPAVRREMF